MKETYWGAPGIGAYCNENIISVSKCKNLVESLLVTGFAYDRQTTIDNNYAEFCWLTHRTRGVRRAGAAAVDMAFVAKGTIDGYWERGLSPWDLAAGIPKTSPTIAVISPAKGIDAQTGKPPKALSQTDEKAPNPKNAACPTEI